MTLRADTRLLLLTVSMALYIASLLLVPFCVSGPSECPGAPGFFHLVFGIIPAYGFVMGESRSTAGLAWMANPLVFLAWAYTASRVSRKLAVGCALASTLLAASFILAKTTENGMTEPTKITQLRLGYWLWLASTIVVSAAATLVTPRPANELSRPTNPGNPIRPESR